MRFAFRPRAELLEVKALLSATPALIRTVASPLVVVVTTDKPVYRIGDPVKITLTETNTSTHDVTVTEGCQILSASASKGGVVVWRYRDLRECPTFPGVLHAHQSRQFTIVWNTQPAATGSGGGVGSGGTGVGTVGPGTIVVNSGATTSLGGPVHQLRHHGHRHLPLPLHHLSKPVSDLHPILPPNPGPAPSPGTPPTPGTYVIQAGVDGVTGTTTIQIVK